MKIEELRQRLYDVEDTIVYRRDLCEDICDPNLLKKDYPKLFWGYIDHYLPGFEEWCDRHLEIQENLALHNSRRNDYVFDMKKLSHAYLPEAQLVRAYLRKADLSNSLMNFSKLIEADLAGADLRDAELLGATLRDAELLSADLRKANLYGASLTRANLYGANLEGANLEGANLSLANLAGADLIGATYDDETVFPEGFDPELQRMMYVEVEWLINDESE